MNPFNRLHWVGFALTVALCSACSDQTGSAAQKASDAKSASGAAKASAPAPQVRAPEPPPPPGGGKAAPEISPEQLEKIRAQLNKSH